MDVGEADWLWINSILRGRRERCMGDSLRTFRDKRVQLPDKSYHDGFHGILEAQSEQPWLRSLLKWQYNPVDA